jgi:hypothetical protein
MKPKEAKKLIGLRVKWDVCVDPKRGYYRQETGRIESVKGRNVQIDGDWKWLPDMINLKETSL